MKFVALSLCWFVCVSALAQQADTIRPSTGRSQYIKSYPDHFFIWPVLKQRKLDFEMKSPSGEKDRLPYKTNKPYSFGLGMYLFELGFELTVAVPLDEQSKRIYGSSKSKDFQLNVLGRKWGADIFWQRYNGFYVDDPDLSIPANEPFPQRPDINIRAMGLSVNRIFNKDKFSFRSAYNFAERQLSSAGSFVVFGSFDHFIIRADSAIIGSAYVENFGKAADVQSIRSSHLGLAPGYTYSLIWKGFFINGTLALGPATNWVKYRTESGEADNDVKVTGYIVARLGLGYNGDRFFGGVTFMNQGRNARFEGVQMSNSQSSFKILVGFRFRETGILRKRIWDLPQIFSRN